MRQASYCIFLLILLCLTACEQETNTTKTITVKMNGLNSREKDLNLLNHVFLEIREVEVYSDDAGWISLPTQICLPDLFYLEGSPVKILVDNAAISVDHLSELKLVLGTHNAIMVGDSLLPLGISDEQQSGFRIKIDVYQECYHEMIIVLRLDPHHSIVEQIDGTYVLKPLILAEANYVF